MGGGESLVVFADLQIQGEKLVEGDGIGGAGAEAVKHLNAVLQFAGVGGGDALDEVLGGGGEAHFAVGALADFLAGGDGEDGDEEEGEPVAGDFVLESDGLAALGTGGGDGRAVVGDEGAGAEEEDEAVAIDHDW